MTEERYKALVPDSYLQILIPFTKMTNPKDSWEKKIPSKEKKKKKERLDACTRPLCG